LAKNSNTKIQLLTHTNTERWSDTESEKTVLLGCILTLLVEQIWELHITKKNQQHKTLKTVHFNITTWNFFYKMVILWPF